EAAAPGRHALTLTLSQGERGRGRGHCARSASLVPPNDTPPRGSGGVGGAIAHDGRPSVNRVALARLHDPEVPATAGDVANRRAAEQAARGCLLGAVEGALRGAVAAVEIGEEGGQQQEPQ